MVLAAGVRITWADLPAPVRSGVEALLGDRVVEAVSQPGGFSPGSADRVRTAGGRRAFVKAVHPTLNEHSPDLHRREARVTAALPSTVPAPRLLDVYGDGGWVALVVEDVDGRHPATPWQPRELSAVLAALPQLADQEVPRALDDLPETGVALAADLAGFDRLAADPPDDLDPWAREHLGRLRGLGRRAPAALAGSSLVHTDVRADNLLLRPDGSVVLVDWPWATRGAAWFDTLAVLVDVRLHDARRVHDVDALLTQHAGADVDPDDLTAVLAGLAAYFLDAARLPPPTGLPTLRAFQAAQGRTVLEWVRERIDGGARQPGSAATASTSTSWSA